MDQYECRGIAGSILAHENSTSIDWQGGVSGGVGALALHRRRVSQQQQDDREDDRRGDDEASSTASRTRRRWLLVEWRIRVAHNRWSTGHGSTVDALVSLGLNKCSVHPAGVASGCGRPKRCGRM